MLTKKWRDHWGLREDPYACEDADKDPILDEVDSSAVHSGFDRIFGNPKVPAPGIVFGEKGSGKSGLRRMMRRRLDEHNEKHPDDRVFFIEYIDFDGYLEQFRRTSKGARNPRKAAAAVLEGWEITDHLDAILSLGVTAMVDEALESGDRVKGLAPKQMSDMLLLTALYYRSPKRTTGEAVRGMRSAMRHGSARGGLLFIGCLLLTILGGLLGVAPHLEFWPTDPGSPIVWYIAGGALAVAAWLGYAWSNFAVSRLARHGVHGLRGLPRDVAPLRGVLESLAPRVRSEFGLPSGGDPATRYDLLRRFLGLLEGRGYKGCYVVMDRIDEPSLLSGSDDRMREFVRRILDIKLLQYPRIALKLFLPIEMESLYRTATPEALKRMRLDKSNLIAELKWTGEELFEISDQRLLACKEGASRVATLADFFEEDFDRHYLRETLSGLGTPRYAFGFLSSLVSEHVRELPNDLEDDDPRWRIPRALFDVVRARWIDQSGLLRRSLN